jgi:hypothetical protein
MGGRKRRWSLSELFTVVSWPVRTLIAVAAGPGNGRSRPAVGLSAVSPAPAAPSQGGLVGRFLRDPGGWTHRTLHLLLRQLAAIGRAAVVPAIIVATIVAAGMLGGWLVRRRRAASVAASTVAIRIRPPESPDQQAAYAFWMALAEHLTSARLWGARRPRVRWQFTADTAGVKLLVLVAATVDAAAVCRIITGAWPGATATIEAPPAPASRDVPSVAGQLRLAAADWLPFNSRPAVVDPLRIPLAGLADCREGETAVIEVAASPASRRRLAHARRAAAGVTTGRPAILLLRILDMIPIFGSPPAVPGRTVDPAAAARAKAADSKLRDGRLFEVTVRYAVTGGAIDRAAAQRRTTRLREISRSFGVLAGDYNRLVPRRLRRPQQLSRPTGKGFLASTSELAALAHLPADPAAAGMVTAGAHLVVPPPEVSYF